MAYVAYHIWLSNNSWVFDLRKLSARFVLERTLIQADEMTHLELADITLRILNFWDPPFGLQGIYLLGAPILDLP